LLFLVFFLAFLPTVHAHPINLDYTTIMTYDDLAAVNIRVPHSLALCALPQQDFFADYVQENFIFRNDGEACLVHVVNCSTDLVSSDVSLLVDCEDDLGVITVTDTFLIDLYPMMKHEVLLLHGGFSKRFELSISGRSFEQDLSGLKSRSAVEIGLDHVGDVGREKGLLSGSQSFLSSRLGSLLVSGSGPMLTVMAVLIAFLLGIVHSLSPGHGKTFAAAYLVGQRRSVKHAVILGGSMAFTHVLDVVVVSLLAVWFSGFFADGSALSVLRDVSAAGILGMGFFMFYRAVHRTAGHGDHPHDHHSVKSTALAGMLGGLAPCPSAWVLFLSILALGRPVLGIMVILSFSLGLSIAIVLIGILVVKASSVLGQKKVVNSVVMRLPVIAALLVMVLGALMLLRVV